MEILSVNNQLTQIIEALGKYTHIKKKSRNLRFGPKETHFDCVASTFFFFFLASTFRDAKIEINEYFSYLKCK